MDFFKKAVPMNDDVFDFIYEALPGYEEVGRRRIPARLLGRVQQPRATSNYDYRNMDAWGNEMFVTPGVVVDGELVTTNLVDINLGIRILLGSSYYEDWANEHTFVDKDPLGNPVDKRHPWNQTTLPKPQKRDLEGGNYSLGDEPALVRQAHRRPPRARHRRRRARAAVGDGAREQGRHAVRERDRAERADHLPQTPTRPRRRSSGRSRSGRTRSSATARGSTSSPTRRHGAALPRQALDEVAPGTRRCSRTSTCPTRRSAAASTRRCAACSRTTW
jgi:hypothetical protein